MKDTFSPPIKSRSTEELLQIVGAPTKWNQAAVSLAKYELANRQVSMTKIETAKYLAKKREKIEKELKANESYTIWDFILRPKSTLFIIMFSWELKKDGFNRKARQQKIIRGVIIAIFLLCFLLPYFN